MGWNAHYADDHVAPILERQRQRRLQPSLSAYYNPSLRGRTVERVAAQPEQAAAAQGGNDGDAVAPLPLGDDIDALLFGTARTREAVEKLRGRNKTTGATHAHSKQVVRHTDKRRAARSSGAARQSSRGRGRGTASGTAARGAAGAAVAAAAQGLHGTTTETAFSRWLAAHRAGILLEIPHMSPAEVALEGERRWAALTEAARAKWTVPNQAAAASSDANAVATTGDSNAGAPATQPPRKRAKEREVLDADVFMDNLRPLFVPDDKVGSGVCHRVGIGNQQLIEDAWGKRVRLCSYCSSEQ